MKTKAAPSDFLGFTLTSLNLKHKRPGYVAFRPVNDVNSDVLWNIFGGIIQSNAESITSSDTFKVECTRVSLPVGSGVIRRPGLYNNFSQECKARTGIVTIENKDNLCLVRAIVVAKAYAKNDPEKVLIRKDRRQRQTRKAYKLLDKVGVKIPKEGAGLPELEKFQNHLKKYKITVYNFNSKGRDVYFIGNNDDAMYKINLLFSDGHFNVITNLTGAFACHYFCEACHTPYDHKGAHRCSSICPACRINSPPCKLELEGFMCSQCNRKFRNRECFIAHQGRVCNTIKHCPDCKKCIWIDKRKSKHVCGEVYCSTCSEFKDPNHMCYMKVDSRKPPSKDFLFVFFDFETRQDDTLVNDPTKNVHKVNLCVSEQYCWKCLSGTECVDCLPRRREFREQPISNFMEYLMQARKQYKNGVCVIAHNGQAFDFQFLLKYVLEKTKFTPELIMRGTKVILMKIDNVRFIDSLNYFPMALSALPKAFELGPELKKGYFPHLFNTEKNQEYVGSIPPKEFYCPESMFKNNHEDFQRWYDEQLKNNYVFDFKKEILEYCVSDVEILAQACLKFRALFLEQCTVDPFLEAVTIASACNLAFRRNFLKPNTIGLIPKNGYRLVDNQSALALQWLSWEEEQRGIRIQHAGREREVKVEGMKVDGYDGERVYEFQGCYYHGCPKCFPFKREKPLKNDPSDTLQQRYERTTAKIERLSKAGHEVIEMWECTFINMKKEQNLTYLSSLPILDTVPLNPRDAFFGGRTGNAKTYHKCTKDEKIQYVDVCSLYPYVCKYGKYPLKHPKIHVGNEECQRRGMEVEGLLKCKILPPSDLYHPVLPCRMNDKLMFVLCRTCGEEMSPTCCEHSEDERAIVGTWTMDEVRKALEKGYTILEMYEMWEYQVATFENGGLFMEFIDKFLKLKQEASGYPSWCLTEEDRQKYIEDYNHHEGIRLDPANIVKNGGLRSLAKLILNSFWGKFGQRENQTKSLVTREPKELFSIFTNPSVEVNCIQEINDDVILVNWQNIDEVGESLRTVNVVLAAYTTAQARLKLYEHLEALGSQVLYYDTDSVLYIFKNGLYRVNTGDYLGQMTDELEEYGPGSYIVEFVSGGPKTYAYVVYSTNKNQLITVCKVKGLTLNLKTSKIVNFEKLKEMILSEVNTTLEVEQSRILRTKERDIVTVHDKKLFRITGPKRRYDGEYDTLPFGYKKQKLTHTNS